MNTPKTPRVADHPVWLAVHPDAREDVRNAAGLLENGKSAIAWDKEANLWYARPGCDLDRIREWLPDPSRRAGGGDAESEFRDVLTQAGLVIQGMPIMDGQRHRVSTVEDKKGKQSGVYRGFLDRRPGGWFINYHRAETAKDVTNWSATGGESDPITRLHIRAGAKQAQEDTARDRAATYAAQTQAALRLYDRLPAADPAHPYLVRKGITPTPELRETRNGALVVPFFNASGAFKTLQYIPPEGEKFLFKDAPKQGHFLVVGGALEPGQPVLYAEGYATARSLNLGTGHPVVMTIDAGNMVAVAKVLHEQFPQSRHVFLADFDHAKDENKGLLMATAAAEAVGGHVLYPAFNVAEKAQGLTDFNDLHLSRGLDALREQVLPIVIDDLRVKTMPEDQKPSAAAQVELTPALRRVLEKQWENLQVEFLSQQANIGAQVQEKLRSGLLAEKSSLKQQVLEESKDKSFGQRLAATAGILGAGDKQEQITNINRALKELDNAEYRGYADTGSLDKHRSLLQNVGEWSIDVGKGNPSAVGDLAKNRDVWITEQAAARLSSEGLAPLARSAPIDPLEVESRVQERADYIVEVAKEKPGIVVQLANSALHQSVSDHSAFHSQQFDPVELRATGAIDARAEAYVDTTAPSVKPGVEPAVTPDDVRVWAKMDTQDLGQIQASSLREYASEVIADNSKAAPVYAQAIELAVSSVPLNTPTDEPRPALELSNVELPAAPADVRTDPVASPVLAEQGPAAVQQPAPVAEAAPVIQASQAAVQAGPVAGSGLPEQPAVVQQAALVVEAAPVIQASQAPVQAEPVASPAMVTEPLAQPSAVQSNARLAEQSEAANTTGQFLPAAALQQLNVAPSKTAEPEAPAAPNDQDVPKPKQPAMAGEQPAEAAVDGIVLGAPRPRGTEEVPQASNIDKDALLARLSWEKQGDTAVLYKLDGEAAFVDHGNRLEMASGASQSDEKVIAALLTAAQYYRGRIELTGSDEFKAKAIELIAHHQINVEMKNPVQQAQLDDARNALNAPPVIPDAVVGVAPPAYDSRVPAPMESVPATQQSQRAAPEPASQATFTAPLSAYQPLEAPDLPHGAPKPSGQPLEAINIDQLTQAPNRSIEPTSVESPANQKISPAIHQPFQAAKDGVQGKVLASGQAPFRFEVSNAESTYIKLRTKTGVQTFWGKELAGLLRDTRVQPGKMVTLQWLGKEPVTVKVPRKDKQGVTLGFDDKEAHRNQWALTVSGSPMVRTGQDEGVKLTAYDAGRFAVVQQALIAHLGVDVVMPTPPRDGLYWLTPNGEGSAKAGDELSAPRPPIDPKNTAGEPVISSWTKEGHLDMYLVRGDGPYLQGVARQGNQFQHVLVSLPGRDDAPPMVFNAITPEGMSPIGTGNGINRSGGEPVARENIAFKLDGDNAVRIGKLDAPASVPPALHARLGFDQRWKEDNVLPKSAPTAAPSVQPNDPRPA
ncbi:LPD7 domain-containing protein (plasmid) [Pseudomonas sp. HR96]|uniref:LPD7 domain-containing protein n=1 Tax=Pseudomonas sp. HR96 TaxID=1027966 RepID=UPI002A753132|nr:LPD7 domain-containing protein [Pseudomonas sp. HR96]WPP02576.1 LPD7 domain-containing protein [Pseudomonas sp. HR96]